MNSSNSPIDSTGDAVNSDGFFLEASVVVFKAPNNCAVRVFFAIFSQNLCDWLLWLVVWVMWSLFIEVLCTRSLWLWLRKGTLLLLLGWSWSLDVESLSVWRNFLESVLLLRSLLDLLLVLLWLMLLRLMELILAFFSDGLRFIEESSFRNLWLWSLRFADS